MGLLDDAYNFVKDTANIGENVAGFINGLGINPIANYNADRDFSKSMDAQRALTQMSYNLSQQNWDRQFDKESRYNLPVNEVMRLRQAGYNPYVKESAANGTMSMPAQSGSGSAASVNPVPNYVDRYSSAFLDSLKGINQGIVNQKTKDMINASIQNLLADSSNKDAQAQYTQLLKNLESEFGGKIRKSSISKIEAEAQELLYRSIREDSEGRYFDAAKYESETRAMLNRVLQGKELKEIEYLMEKIKTWSTEVSSIVNLNRAKAGEAHANEREANANADVRELEYDLRQAVYNDELESKLKDFHTKKALSDAEYSEALARMQKAQDLMDARNYSSAFRVFDDLCSWIAEKVHIVIGGKIK